MVPVFDLLRAGRSRHDLPGLYRNATAVANDEVAHAMVHCGKLMTSSPQRFEPQYVLPSGLPGSIDRTRDRRFAAFDFIRGSFFFLPPLQSASSFFFLLFFPCPGLLPFLECFHPLLLGFIQPDRSRPGGLMVEAFSREDNVSSPIAAN